MSVDSLSPSGYRARFRSGKDSGQPTSGICLGHVQANVVVVHRKLADDFSHFCKQNSAPLPVLYQSKTGEVGCSLAAESDIRTDLTQYSIIRDGALCSERPSSLLDQKWDDLVTFYLGCSFSFEESFARHGIPVRNVEQKRNVAMYVTSIECQSAGPFCTNLVVSMRPIPRDLVPLAVDATRGLALAHGAPIHIGDPSQIGIEDIDKPDFGDSTSFQPEDVPVFWACGVTGIKAVQSKGVDLAFAHSPGCMFVCDLKSDAVESKGLAPVRVVQISSATRPYVASLVTERIASAIDAVERSVISGVWRKGVEQLGELSRGSLLKAALSLSHSNRVAVTTGFPCVQSHDPPDETDGPSGLLAIARALLACGKTVSVILDRKNRFLVRVVETALREFVSDKIEIISYSSEDNAESFIGTHRFDHLVAIERSGKNVDGRNLTMTARDVTHLLDPIDELFEVAPRMGVKTICIGDGGNELGFGQLRDAVARFVDFGARIACCVPSDFLVVCGVSNWGGYAIAGALYLLRQCPVHLRYVLKGICEENVRSGLTSAQTMPSVDLERRVLEYFTSAGLHDGIDPNLAMSVDGRKFDDEHAEKLREILRCCSLVEM